MEFNKLLVKTLIVTFSVFCSCVVDIKLSEAQLQVGFYSGTCASAETIVKQEVANGFFQNSGVAAGLVRMHFHDCFVRGCDGSVLIDSTSSNQAEKDAPPNNPSLRGFEVIDNAKARIEAECEGETVSCADILAFAARDSVEITGGFGYDVPAGRRDGRVSIATETLTNLPPPFFNLTQLTTSFANKNLTQEEMVTLSGAHTLGQSHCTSFVNRLYNFSSTVSQDPTLDTNYANLLKQKCPLNPNASLVVPMDPPSPAVSDVSYYKGVLDNKGLFSSDQALLTSTQTKNQVIQNIQNQFSWSSKFAAAMVKMGKIEVVTGNNGEIRTNCRVIN